MRTIETTAVVTAEHTITVTVPDDIPPGVCPVVIVIGNGRPTTSNQPLPFGIQPHNVGPVDPNNTFRREDMYGDDGR